MDKSLITKGLDGVQPTRFQGRKDTREQAHDRTDHDAVEHPILGDHEAGIQDQGEQVAHPDSQQDAKTGSHQADQDGLHQKLAAYHARLPANGFDQSHFTRTFRNGDQHDIHESDRRPDQGDQSDDRGTDRQKS